VLLGAGPNKRSRTEGRGAAILLPPKIPPGAKGPPGRPASIPPGPLIVPPVRSGALPFRRIRFPGRATAVATFTARTGVARGAGK
jgi:hypothetical protein